MANYSFKPMPPVPDNKTFTSDNFYQLEPETVIFEGVAGLKFIKCNLTNCKIPADAEVISSRHVQVDFCTNIRPDLVDMGLDACITECSHMLSKDEIIIDGILIDTFYKYQDTRIL